MIRRAKILEINDILDLTKACAASMIEKGIYQWNEDYPSKEAFKKDIERKELYVLERNGSIAGIIAISILMDEEYLPVKWSVPHKNNIYIHRLGIHPAHQGKGYATANNFGSVRLDTFSQNKRNQKIYETRGYKKLGDVYFPKQSDYPFHCYELVL